MLCVLISTLYPNLCLAGRPVWVHQLVSFSSSYLSSSVNERYLQENQGTREVRVWFLGLHFRSQGEFLPVPIATALARQLSPGSVATILSYFKLMQGVHRTFMFPHMLPDVAHSTSPNREISSFLPRPKYTKTLLGQTWSPAPI